MRNAVWVRLEVECDNRGASTKVYSSEARMSVVVQGKNGTQIV